MADGTVKVLRLVFTILLILMGHDQIDYVEGA